MELLKAFSDYHGWFCALVAIATVVACWYRIEKHEEEKIIKELILGGWLVMMPLVISAFGFDKFENSPMFYCALYTILGLFTLQLIGHLFLIGFYRKAKRQARSSLIL